MFLSRNKKNNVYPWCNFIIIIIINNIIIIIISSSSSIMFCLCYLSLFVCFPLGRLCSVIMTLPRYPLDYLLYCQHKLPNIKLKPADSVMAQLRHKNSLAICT